MNYAKNSTKYIMILLLGKLNNFYVLHSNYQNIKYVKACILRLKKDLG
jgi:hypothetical protein